MSKTFIYCLLILGVYLLIVAEKVTISNKNNTGSNMNTGAFSETASPVVNAGQSIADNAKETVNKAKNATTKGYTA